MPTKPNADGGKVRAFVTHSGKYVEENELHLKMLKVRILLSRAAAILLQKTKQREANAERAAPVLKGQSPAFGSIITRSQNKRLHVQYLDILSLC